MFINIDESMKNGKTYNGNTRKFGVTIDGGDYIVKFPKDDDLSVYCEYLASNLIRKLGIPCHEVYLGRYNGIVVDVIKDFTQRSITLHSFKDTKQSSEDKDLSVKEYTYSDVLYLIDKHLKMSDDRKLEAKERFWDMFICDAIIGNRDRHWGNWGYLNNGKEYRFAPLYDNGAGLFPGVVDHIEEYTSNSQRVKFLKDRIFVFPASLFKIRKPDRSYRSNYYEMFSDLRINRIFAQRVNRFRRSVNAEFICNIMYHLCEEVGLPFEYKRFFTEIVVLRYMCIVCRKGFESSYKLAESWCKRLYGC